MAKVAPGVPGDPFRWELNYYFDITNTSTTNTVTIDSVALSINGGASTQQINTAIPPKGRMLFGITTTPNGALPAPTSATAVVNAHDYTPLVQQLSLSLYQSPAPRGAFDFPLNDSDLPKFTYWGNFERTDSTSHHHGDLPQYYAYDILGYRLNSSNQWVTTTKDTADKSKNSSYLAWNKPLRSIGDGTVLECRRSLADNTPGVMDPAHRFGNAIWIKLDSGEVVAYAHTKQFSIPTSICPTESVSLADASTPTHAQPVRVYTGEVLGRIGNTGNTSEPHVHMQLVAQAPYDEDDSYSYGPGLPLAFDGYRTRSRIGLTQNAKFGWVDVPRGQGAVLPDFGLLQPHVCGWNPPPPAPALKGFMLVRLSESCYQSRFDDAVRAGYLPTVIDGYTVAGKVYFNVIFRANRPTTAAYAEMTSSDFKAKRSSLEGQGYRIIHLDLFRRGAGLRYNAVWVKDGGPETKAYGAKSIAGHTAQFNSLKKKGFVPLAISAVVKNGQTLVSAVYEKKNAGKFDALGGVSLSSLQSTFDKEVKAGLRPTYVDAYTSGGTPHFSLIFTQKASKNFKMKHNQTTAKVLSLDKQQRKLGRVPVAVTGYQVGSNGTRFAAIWRK